MTSTSTEESDIVPTFQSILLVTFDLVSTVLRARVERSILKEMSPLQCLLATLMSSRITSCSGQVCRCDIRMSTRKYFANSSLLASRARFFLLQKKITDADISDERLAAEHSGVNDLSFNPNGQFSKMDITKGSTNVSRIARLITVSMYQL